MKTTTGLSTSELGCATTLYSYNYGYYGLLGYAVKALNGANISPSISYVLANRPDTIKIINTPSGTTTIPQEKTCDHLFD